MHEYESIQSFDEVSQGDVIEWDGPHRASPWHTFGVVVTADCDLSLGKHKGYISYVPAWPTVDFVWYHWRPEIFGRAQNDALSTLAKRISTWRQKNSDAGEVSPEAVSSWLQRVGAERLLDDLGVTARDQRNSLIAAITPFVELEAFSRSGVPDIDLLSQMYRHVKPKASSDPSLITRDLQQYCNSLPGDIFHLPSTPEGEDDDLFLMLRHIRQVGADDVTARPEDLRSGIAKAKRVARVTAPFRYAITQNLARVFADIGLPDEYDTRRVAAVDRLFFKWSRS